MSQETEPPDAQLGAPALAQSDVESLELFRRSPHPYLRHRNEILSARAQASTETTTLTTPRSSDPAAASDDSDAKPGKQSQSQSQSQSSPSESGTEADDEGYGFVKALPAPPLRPRKGLRDVRGAGGGGGSEYDGTASPLLTPSQVDEEGRRYAAEYFKDGKKGGGGGGGGSRSREASPTDEEAKAARLKYLKRRRNELVRRTTEAALLGGIGLLAVRGCACWEKLLQWHRVELLTHVLVMAGVLALYPLRLLYYSRRRNPSSTFRIRQRIRIPAAFDPAPILYPPILPVLISISLFGTFHQPLLPNILLGLAALPHQLIPYGVSPLGQSTVHWFVSILPLIAAENTEFPSKLFPPMPYKLKAPPPEEGLHPEILVSLFALHHALLPPLHYLTTTSLLPAELHLLSIALINLLLFADSPQTAILRTIIWVGGLGLFALCGKVLKWGVALARIPRWRFRRVGQIIRARQSFLQTLNETLKPSRRSNSRALSDSDADEDDPMIKPPLTKTKSLKLNTKTQARLANGAEPQSAVEKKTSFEGDDEKVDSVSSLPKRRNTLPSLHSLGQGHHHRAHRRRSKSIAQSFLSLTPTQAAVRKWLYAGYFYLVVVVMILGPIRYLIDKYALHAHEPFGWAIGYLFGNVQKLRFQVLNWDLDWWVALPPMLDPDDVDPSQRFGFIEYLRQVAIGQASVRLLLCLYCASIIVVGLIIVLRLSSVVEVDTRRKVFHGMMVAMLLPTIFVDPCFVSLALALVLAIFLLLDLIRASQLPPLSRPLANFLTPYVDGRDLRGPVVVSHIFLLIGCAIPLWLSLAGTERGGQDPWEGWEVKSRDVSMVAGVVCVGMGDAAASLIGRRYGRRKWPWAGGKSLEGSLAFAVAVTVGLVAGKIWLGFGWNDAIRRSVTEWAVEGITVVVKAAVCAAGASLNEAVLTGGNDNVIVPVVLWVLVRGVRL
ncbi:hypothetical protein BS50DRAFT_639951 [Corynespora cassiicola Philippines]|uniref:dolichol kinase n=1 Tax=Corynespora cassiicola Philippines TaxID=1448308 RepID=A0A2T2N543_CORCC|nr:hypothetical protein BS50DRAFT_639951 [Corynespora cassiicola Philippines]